MNVQIRLREGNYFSRRWHGQVSVDTLFWRDTIFFGTLINIGMTFAALMALGFHVHAGIASAIYFAAVPYNLFLVICLWRYADRLDLRQAGFVRAGAVLWLLIATFI